MQQQELDALMADSADNAVHTARSEFDIELDFSRASIKQVDNIILQFIATFQDKALEDTAVFTICNIYGAYVGETFRKVAGGQWRYDDSDPETPFVVLDVNDRSYAFAGICYERLVNDSKVSIKRYFELALEHQQQ